MKESEFRALAAAVQAYWPHAEWPAPTQAAYFEQLRDVDVRDALMVLRELTLEREHPPTAGTILQRVMVQHAPPDWDEVAAEVRHALKHLPRGYSPAAGSWPEAPPPESWSHPLIAEFVRTRVSLREFERGWGDAAFRAQARDVWQAMVRRERRRVARGLPEPTRPELEP